MSIPPAADPQLMELLNFNAHDLAANKAGRLSKGQMAQLKAEDREEFRGLVFGLMILGLLGAVALFICAFLINLRVIIETQGPLLRIGVGLGAGLMGLVLYANWQGAKERAAWPDVATLVGELEFSIEQRGSREFHYIFIGGTKLFISPEVHNGLQRHRRQHSGYEYRLHYATRARKVLSGEVVKVLE